MKKLIAVSAALALGLGVAACDAGEEEVAEEGALVEEEAEVVEPAGTMAGEGEMMTEETEVMEEGAEVEGEAETM